MIEEPEKYCEKLFAQSYAFFFLRGAKNLCSIADWICATILIYISFLSDMISENFD